MNRILVLLLMPFLVSCSLFSPEDGSFISRPFSDVDANRTIVVSTNRTFEIVLTSNRSTGYSWVLQIDNPEVVSRVSDTYIADKSGRLGVAGQTIWLLKSNSKGNAVLTFSYQRPSEEEIAPSRVVNFIISVR